MKRLIEQRYGVRRNLVAIIGFCLCFYFTYHVLFGERSLVRLVMLETGTSRLEADYQDLHEQRLALENKVIRMRPDSLDRDLAEEQVRHMLGYVRADDKVIFLN